MLAIVAAAQNSKNMTGVNDKRAIVFFFFSQFLLCSIIRIHPNNNLIALLVWSQVFRIFFVTVKKMVKYYLKTEKIVSKCDKTILKNLVIFLRKGIGRVY
jgi:hypothetical protein